MKHFVWLLLALGCVHIHSAPVDSDDMEEASCKDAFALGAAEQALSKINKDRQEGYIFGLHRLSNVHTRKHGETGVVFYLTLDVVETNCSVLSRNDNKFCKARPIEDTPVYGQCKSVIYFNRPHRVVRLIKYSCSLRPVPAARIFEVCPDCPTLFNTDDAEIQKTVSDSLEKFNKESGLTSRFALLKVNLASSSMGMATFYNAEYTIQETTCANSADTAASDKCPLMECEFAHKGFCKASRVIPLTDEARITVECEIYEPEAAEREKKLHLLGGETDHSHNDTHNHNHDHAHAADQTHAHDHVHDHTKSHTQHDKTHKHGDNSTHHHTHDHAPGSTHRHAHTHSHDHGHGHDHVHSHHAKAHDHSGDSPNQHHNYKHANDEHSHEHDHELALDHDHKHGHLHEHEHHHHHHDHTHETAHHDHPEGRVKMLPAIDQPTTLPFFPENPTESGVTLPFLPDPQIPGQSKPVIVAFPTSVSAQCDPSDDSSLVNKLFMEDPLFKAAA